MSAKVKINGAGIRRILLSGKVRSAVASRADAMAGHLSGIQSHEGPVPIERDSYTSDRAVEGVTLAHASGIGLQAEYGYLHEAAAAAGLEVGKKGRK
ncbi:hypothetical protein SEA_GARDENSTATE_10 [Microbacterium phage GardenState]|uniref:Uncharacterized protein n=2 Tax=Gardenstatevirus TaxID=3425012 RepID=A0A4Y6E8W1_9CAUD|nr:hypothetical protein SEA_IAMGROOT_10 [Microbacterium phage IAmGroot]QOI66922.1 hypothetical protein SEA_GARDENSTATE_10 [Microbacterium phage GardenState]